MSKNDKNRIEDILIFVVVFAVAFGVLFFKGVL